MPSWMERDSALPSPSLAICASWTRTSISLAERNLGLTQTNCLFVLHDLTVAVAQRQQCLAVNPTTFICEPARSKFAPSFHPTPI
jgi:hypothetical protein